MGVRSPSLWERHPRWEGVELPRSHGKRGSCEPAPSETCSDLATLWGWSGWPGATACHGRSGGWDGPSPCLSPSQGCGPGALPPAHSPEGVVSPGLGQDLDVDTGDTSALFPFVTTLLRWVGRSPRRHTSTSTCSFGPSATASRELFKTQIPTDRERRAAGTRTRESRTLGSCLGGTTPCSRTSGCKEVWWPVWFLTCRPGDLHGVTCDGEGTLAGEGTLQNSDDVHTPGFRVSPQPGIPVMGGRGGLQCGTRATWGHVLHGEPPVVPHGLSSWFLVTLGDRLWLGRHSRCPQPPQAPGEEI